MGREIRNVPEQWQHPRYDETDATRPSMIGHHRPQFEETLAQRMAQDPESAASPEHYRPAHLAGGTHVQLYESATEGTPISPVFPDVASLAQHLSTNGDDRSNVWPQRAISVISTHRYICTSEAMAYGV